MSLKKATPLILLLVMLILVFVLKQCNNDAPDPSNKTTATRGLNRNPAHITYSRHAQCRMACRHIDQSEIQEILHSGKINYAKSDLKEEDCHKKYAVEGTTHDRQKVRIIFAPCAAELTVVTVIDLGKDWPCNCDEGSK